MGFLMGVSRMCRTVCSIYTVAVKGEVAALYITHSKIDNIPIIILSAILHETYILGIG